MIIAFLSAILEEQFNFIALHASLTFNCIAELLWQKIQISNIMSIESFRKFHGWVVNRQNEKSHDYYKIHRYIIATKKKQESDLDLYEREIRSIEGNHWLLETSDCSNDIQHS